MHMGAWAPLEIFRSDTWVSKRMDGEKKEKKLEGGKKGPENSFGCLLKVKRVKPLFYLN